MSVEQQQRLFDACLDAATQDERERLLAACRDASLCDSVRELLRAHDEAPDSLPMLLDAPAFPRIAAPHQIGSYRILGRIGEGAMGEVFVAQQQAPVRRRVALKILKFGLGTREVLARFELERQTLALLTHPNIARIFDAGTTSDGRPYFAMEHVPGIPITRYCDERRLDIPARLALCAQVCAGVQHAHLRGVIHRDLKPSNILVCEVDGAAVAKIIDFGIAKAATNSNADAYTRIGHLLGTPEYMSPEQAQLSPLDIDARTDVYSLGIVLYQLLTGSRPYSVTGDALNPAVLLNEIVSHESRRPSDIAAERSPESAARAGQRNATPASLAAMLRGDLDWIVLKAIEKDRQRRYDSPAALAADLQRHVVNEPVLAGPPSNWYRFGKFVRRHRLAVGALSAAFVAAIVFGSAMAWFAREAVRQRDRAVALSARNAAVVEFVSGMLTEAAPDDEPIRIGELLERSQRILLTGEADPEHQAAILDVLADYYLSAGDAMKAQPLLDRAVQLTADSSDRALKATLICNNAYAVSLLNRRDEALRALEGGIAMSSVDPLAAARCLQKRAFVAQNFNDPEGALKYALQAQASLRQAPVRKPDQEASLTGDVAYAHYLSGRTAEADRYYAQALTRYAQIGRAESPATFSLRNNWGIASFAAGDNRRALENYDEALRIARKRNPEGDAPVYLLSNRALALASLARYPEALEAFDAAAAAADRTNSVASQLHALVNRAGTYLMMGDVERADRELSDIEQKYGAAIPPDSVPAVTIHYIKGRLAAARGNLPKALSELTAAIEFFDKRQMAVAPVTRALNARAEVHIKRGDIENARLDARRAVEISRKLQDAKPYSSLTGLSLLQLADVEAAADAAANARERAREAASHLTETLGPAHPETLRAKALAAG